MALCNIRRTNTILYCRRWETTVAFYRDVLGLAVHQQTEWLVEFELTGEAYVSIANAARTSIKNAGGRGITLSWRVEDAACAHRRLSDLGVAVGAIRRVWGSPAFYFFDPEGHRIELWS